MGAGADKVPPAASRAWHEARRIGGERVGHDRIGGERVGWDRIGGRQVGWDLLQGTDDRRLPSLPPPTPLPWPPIRRIRRAGTWGPCDAGFRKGGLPALFLRARRVSIRCCSARICGSTAALGMVRKVMLDPVRISVAARGNAAEQVRRMHAGQGNRSTTDCSA